MKKVVCVVIIETIHNQKMYAQYINEVVPIINAHKGEYIARSNNIVAIAGNKPERSIIIGFDSLTEAQQCFCSDAYQKIKHLREESTESTVFFIEND